MSEERIKQLRQFLESDPDDPFLLFSLAREYDSLGDVAKSLEYYNRTKHIDPDYVGLYYHLGKLYERLNDYDNARATYEVGVAIARKIGDRHALSELQAALMNLEV